MLIYSMSVSAPLREKQRSAGAAYVTDVSVLHPTCAVGRYRRMQRKPMWLVDVSTASAWRAAGL